VKWSGYGHEQNSWEPLAHLNENCQEDVVRLLAERQVASSSERVRARGRHKKSAPALNLIQRNKALDQVQLEMHWQPLPTLRWQRISRLEMFGTLPLVHSTPYPIVSGTIP
jgi:hypothetical protein